MLNSTPSHELSPTYSFYNPYLHGTTSATLALMPKTDFQLMPVLKMLDDFYTAPMVGELTQGGYSFIGFKRVQEEAIGATSFGNLKTGDYNLKKITASYTRFAPSSNARSEMEIQNVFKYSLANGFSNFNLILIYLARLRQLGSFVGLTDEQLALLKTQLDATLQFYYFIQLLGTHIHPDFAAMDNAVAQSKSLEKIDITDAVYEVFHFEYFIQKFLSKPLDMKEMVLNPTEENLKKALEYLELPKHFTIKPWNREAKSIELPLTQFFTLTKQASQRQAGYVDEYSSGHFGHFSRNIDGYRINNFLEQFLLEKVDASFFSKMANDAKNYVVAFEDRIRLFNKLISADPHHFQVDADMKKLVDANFPVILLSESKKIQPYFNEFRSMVPLKLAEDIRLVATDTLQHQQELKQYFDKHQVGPIQVLLISDLEKTNTPEDLPLSIDGDGIRSVLTATKKSQQGKLFYEFYRLMDVLNDKRNQYRGSHPQVFNALDSLLMGIESELKDHFQMDKPVTSEAIHRFCEQAEALIHQHQKVLEAHRGVLGVVDTVLTVLASLVVFYPLVCWYQKTNHKQYTFFNTDSGSKLQQVQMKLNTINEVANHFPTETESQSLPRN